MDMLRDQYQQGDSSKADQADLHDEMDPRDPAASRYGFTRNVLTGDVPGRGADKRGGVPTPRLCTALS